MKTLSEIHEFLTSSLSDLDFFKTFATLKKGTVGEEYTEATSVYFDTLTNDHTVAIKFQLLQNIINLHLYSKLKAYIIYI